MANTELLFLMALHIMTAFSTPATSGFSVLASLKVQMCHGSENETTEQFSLSALKILRLSPFSPHAMSVLSVCVLLKV